MTTNAMADTDKPLLEFPSEYTVKVLGRDQQGFVERVAQIVSEHAPNAAAADVRPSSKGSFVSINICFTAVSMQQLDDMHRALNACEQVTLIL